MEVSDCFTRAFENHTATNKGNHSIPFDDCSNELIEVDYLEFSQLFQLENLEEFDSEDEFDVSKLLAQDLNSSMVENSEEKLK
ncbi:hypothetical protein PanWU01x14_372210, partial [Parasponia andersonii]